MATKTAPDAKITMNTKTGQVKVTAKGKTVETAPPKKPEKPKEKGPKLPAVYRDGTHSAIVLEIAPKAVTLITMASLKIEEMRRVEFDASFELYADYPVRRCAEIYLGSGKYRLIDPETRERLQAIVADKATEYKPFASATTEEKSMTKSIPTPNHPLRRASDAPVREALKAAGVPVAATAKEGAKPKDKPTEDSAPKKTAAAKKTSAAPAPAKKTAAEKTAPAQETKAAPAKTPAKETAKPAAKKAPWDKGTAPAEAAKGAAKKTAPAVPKAKFGGDTKVKMGDTTKAKRGKMLTFIEAAIELAKKGKGATTREAIEAKVKDAWEGDDLNTYFPYAVKNGLLVLA